MDTGLEMRFPFLEDRLIRTMFQMPMGIRIGNGDTKSFLRMAIKGLVPEQILSRAKSPFGLPAARKTHFKGSGTHFKKPAFQEFFWKYYDKVSEAVMEGDYLREGIFKEGIAIRHLAPQKTRHTCRFDPFLWKLWNFAGWYQNWMV
jgi:asparagine synthetase B (glutamine-hydrolysing)